MNFLIVIDDLYSGGAQRQMVKLALAFRGKGHRVSVLYYYQRDFYGDILSDAGIELFCLQHKNPLHRIWAFRKFIRKGNFNVVISYLGIPSFLCELAAIPYKRWKLIVNERSANPAILRSFKSIFIRFFHLFADKVVTNSYANKKIIQKANPLLKGKKLKVIYNMMDLDEWKPADGFMFRKNGKITLLVAASHRHLKNFMGVLKAISLLTEQEREKISIKWYGNNLTPPYYDDSIDECRDFIQKNNLDKLVTLYPATLDIKEPMQQADIIGLFSFFEGLPNVVCEGMTLGKPILASAVSDIPLLVEDNVNGKVVDPKDPESIAAGLRFFIHTKNSTLLEMGVNSRKKALEYFDQEMIMKSYQELIG